MTTIRERRRTSSRAGPAGPRADVLLRGNPVIYYGDEQGFTGRGGDQVARQTMFASKVSDYLDDDLLGTDRTHAQDNFNPDHQLYERISQLGSLTKAHPALRNGPHQTVTRAMKPIYASPGCTARAA